GKRSDAFDDGGTEWFGRQPPAHVADHDVGAAGFHTGLPARFKTTRHSDQSDHRGNADRDAHDREPGAHGPPHESAGDDDEKGHVGSWLSASETMRPSFISMIRAAWWAMPKSCVTRMSVSFCSRRRPTIRLRISSAFSLSRLPVGSSASRTVAPLARLRAM